MEQEVEESQWEAWVLSLPHYQDAVGLSEAHISSGQGHRLQRESIMPMLPLQSLERK